MQSPRTLSNSAIALLVISSTLVGAVLGMGMTRYGVAQGLITDGAPNSVDFSSVWRAWRIIDERFVPAAVASSTPFTATSTQEAIDKRVFGMISGLVDSLEDPYSFFLPPVENQEFADSLSGLFEGVGMEIDVKDGSLTVVSPIKDSPAYRAGIKAGDIVDEIDGIDTTGLSVEVAVKKIRGPKGTVVTLAILRKGWTEPRDFKVTREIINVPTVTTEEKAGGVFVISIRTFTANSTDLFRAALREFIQSGKTSLVLDLRGNPGGYLEASVDMASFFLPSGATVVTEDYAGHGANIVHRSSGYNIFNNNLKLVVLVDKGSASASEILAGALRDHGKAKLIGTNTFGKGSVQELIEITPDTSLKLTVARWVAPGGEHIPLTGIVPDIVVEVTEEDVSAGEDPQMAKALEYLSSL